jgi:hypothetical protein
MEMRDGVTYWTQKESDMPIKNMSLMPFQKFTERRLHTFCPLKHAIENSPSLGPIFPGNLFSYTLMVVLTA